MEPKSPEHERRLNLTEKRKNEHIRVCLEEDVRAKNVTTGFEDVFLIHRTLPEIDLKQIDTATTFLNHRFSAPIIVEGITGGTEEALKINAAVAQAVEELGLGMGVGSQRAAIENPKLEQTYSIVRKKAPTAFIIANIGAPQLKRGYGPKEAKKAIDMVEADALAIHLNPLQEAIQPEGETDYAGVLEKIRQITSAVDVPVVAKETGAGIAAEEARNLKDAGVSAIDVAGVGGTSWAAVEYYRAKQRGDLLGQELGRVLWDWGIPTAVSLIEVTRSAGIPVIASGGMRSGEDAAKAVALGADLAGFAGPVLEPALKGSEEVKRKIGLATHLLKTVMFLVGADSVRKLKTVPVAITGKTAERLRSRGFSPEIYAERGG